MQEKRRIQRISFEAPLSAQLGPATVRLCDLSTTGARIEHPTGFAPGGVFTLTIDWNGQRTELRSVVTRCRLAPATSGALLRYHCGLRFAEVAAESRATLHRLLATFVEATSRARGRREKSGPRSAQN